MVCSGRFYHSWAPVIIAKKLDKIIYIVVASVLFGLELLYFLVAERYKIIDKPNERSSHKHPTIRGGGIIFIFSVLIFSLLHSGAYPYLLAAVFLSGAVSFIDDIKSLPNWLRFLAHVTSATLILYQAGLFQIGILMLLICLVLIIGVINAYNFMDGINGITGFYTIAIIIPLLITEQDSLLKELELYTLIGLIVFLFFNARKTARCFAGDVGSVSMAIIVVFMLIMRMYNEQNINYFGFLLLYGTDTVLTIIQRLYLKENIFKAHRRHLFQIYCNEYKVSHLVVGIAYGIIQLGVNWIILSLPSSPGLLLVLIFSTGIVYISLKLVAYRRLKGKAS